MTNVAFRSQAPPKYLMPCDLNANKRARSQNEASPTEIEESRDRKRQQRRSHETRNYSRLSYRESNTDQTLVDYNKHPGENHNSDSRRQAGSTTASFRMVPVEYSECVSVAQLPAHQDHYFVTYADFELRKRNKESVELGTTLYPVGYRDSVVCYIDSTRKRYISRVNYETRVRPRRFSETCYMWPKQLTRTYVSFMDHHVDQTRRWYKSTMELKAKTYSSTKVHNFEHNTCDNAVTHKVQVDGSYTTSTSKSEDLINGNLDINSNVEDDVFVHEKFSSHSKYIHINGSLTNGEDIMGYSDC